MTVPLFPGDIAGGLRFTLGLNWVEIISEVVRAPWSLQVAGPYDGVSRTGYSIVFGPTIMGGADGVNNLFTLGVCNQRYQVWRNGLLQTLGTVL